MVSMIYENQSLNFTASMLRENPQSRPNIYQVVREVCLMRGTDIPIKDVSSFHEQSIVNSSVLDLRWADCVRGPT